MSQEFFYSHAWITFSQVRAHVSGVHTNLSTALSTGCAHPWRRVPHGDPPYPQGPVDVGLGDAPGGGLRSPSASSGNVRQHLSRELSERDLTVVLERPRTR